MSEQPPRDVGGVFEGSLARVWRTVFHRLAARFGDPQLAEEVSTDCLSKAWEVWSQDPGYFREHDLTAWTSQRASWRAVDRLRRRGRHHPLPGERGEEDGRGWKVAPGQARREGGEKARDQELTWECLQRLSPQERDVLVGHYFEGKSDRELGSILFGESGTPQARGLRVWRLRQKATTHLRDLLLAEGVDPADWGAGGQAV